MDETKQRRLGTVKLNVGGHYFETTADTLTMFSFFDSMLSERMPSAVDENGRSTCG